MAEALIVRDVALIDGIDTSPLEYAAIAIQGGRVTAVGPASEVPEPEGVEVIDGRGLWAVPGLIDTHVHVPLVRRRRCGATIWARSR